MLRDTSARVLKLLTTAASLFFLGYVAIRAVRVPFTYDEAATYLRFISTDVLSLFSFPVATNHILNTLLTKGAYLIAGSQDWALRLPNVVGYAAYAVFSIQILRRITSPLIAFSGFMLLNSNPYVLEYFALSRGYGLSLALMLGSLAYLFRFMERPAPSTDGDGLILRALLLAGAAVAASFTLLNVAIGILAIAVGASIVSQVTGAAPPDPETAQPAVSRRSFVWLFIGAAIFVALTFSQDLGLTGRLYEPVVVTLPGLEADAATVFRIDFRGRSTRLVSNAGEWRLASPTHVSGLRIELPGSSAARLQRIIVTIGNRSFSNARLEDAWRARDAGATRVFESLPTLSLPRPRIPAFGSVINWSGDSTQAACVAAFTGLALAILVLFAGLLEATGRLLNRLGLLGIRRWRTIAFPALAIAAVAGVPLYLLKRGGELYFGGTQGFVQDTVNSLITDALHGKTYLSNQSDVVSACVLLTVAAGIAIMVWHARRGRASSILPALCLLLLLALVSAVQIAEQRVLGTPSLIGRTALFYLPLYVLFVIFVFDGIARLGRAGTIVASAAMTLALAFAVFHFSQTANVTHTRDWYGDASTKAMIADLERAVAAQPPARSPTRLAVYSFYYPVALFYGQKSRIPLQIEVAPGQHPADFVYLRDGSQDATVEVISRYPLTRSILGRVTTSR